MADERVNHLAAGVQYLHPVVLPVADIDASAVVHGQSVGAGESVAAVAAVIGGGEPAAGVKLLYPVVAPVGDIDIARGVNGNAPGHIELPRPGAKLAPGRQRSAGGVKTLHPMVQRIHHQQRAVRRKGNAGGTVEPAGSGAKLAPAADKLPLRREYADAVRVFIGQVKPAVRPEGDGRNPDKLPRRRAPAAELADVIAVNGAARYPHRLRLVGVGAAGHIQQAVIRTQGQRHRPAEPRPAAGQQADDIVILVEAGGGEGVFGGGGHKSSLWWD